MADTGVKGMSEATKQAEEGMKLFTSQEKQITYDVPGATAYKDDVENVIAALDEEINGLAGKDNKKARTEKEKEKKKVKDDLKYIDACKVMKGLEPKNGNFQQAVEPGKEQKEVPAAVAEEKKDDDKKDKKEKPKKAQESAGISKAERDELEKLKNDIIARKKELKDQGLSGGQCNKDEVVVQWVQRMNELKEKEDPGSTIAKKDDKKAEKKMLSAESTALIAGLENEFNEYTEKLRTEFKYSKKEIAADPDYIELLAKVNAAKGIKQKK